MLLKTICSVQKRVVSQDTSPPGNPPLIPRIIMLVLATSLVRIGTRQSHNYVFCKFCKYEGIVVILPMFRRSNTTKSDEIIKIGDNTTQLSESGFNKKYEESQPVPMDPKFTKRRDKIVHEIFTSEFSYVRGLQLLVNLFYQPLLQAVKGGDISVTEKKIAVIFNNIEKILSVHESLLVRLKEKILNWSETQVIGDVMSEFMPSLEVYKVYTQGYEDGCNGIREAELRDRRFTTCLEKLTKHPLLKNQMIDSYLILPVQRVPRYVMLLNDLISNTPESHPDYENILSSFKQIKIVAASINDAVAAAENYEKCLQIQRLFQSTNSKVQVIEQHRKFIHDGWLIKQCRKERKLRRFFLFNDICIYCFEAAGTGYYIMSGTIELSKSVVLDYPDQDKLENGFMISTQGKSFLVYADTREIKMKWLTLFSEAISNQRNKKSTNTANENSSTTSNIDPVSDTNNTDSPVSKNENGEDFQTAPLWIPDDALQVCTLCKRSFTIITRRHHCRACGQLVCGNCSRNRMLVPAVDKKNKVRVCEFCFVPSSSGQSSPSTAKSSTTPTSPPATPTTTQTTSPSTSKKSNENTKLSSSSKSLKNSGSTSSSSSSKLPLSLSRRSTETPDQQDEITPTSQSSTTPITDDNSSDRSSS
eukprot:TRINITY_DN1917_c0_g1_i7.p1 TRINITY_DN1917_c0_g1~~TRINITY_DN1917_c0_g1_i7.p1  ORF type:complete len:645 (-),score=90.90 TRINITY_DN1917_c0_g1_i7:266-2200(-)